MLFAGTCSVELHAQATFQAHCNGQPKPPSLTKNPRRSCILHHNPVLIHIHNRQECSTGQSLPSLHMIFSYSTLSYSIYLFLPILSFRRLALDVFSWLKEFLQVLPLISDCPCTWLLKSDFSLGRIGSVLILVFT